VYHSTLGLRVINEKKKNAGTLGNAPLLLLGFPEKAPGKHYNCIISLR